MRGPLLLMVNIFAIAGMLGAVLSAHAPADPVVDVVPLGAVDRDLVLRAAGTLVNETTLLVDVREPLPMPQDHLDPWTGRHRAEALLASLQPRVRDGAWKTVFITGEPLETGESPSESPLSGLGAVKGRTCVLSSWTFEMRSVTRASLVRRMGALVLHETGHTLGLHHCGVGGCVMRPSTGDTVAWADLGSNTYCVLCRLKLPAGIVRGLPGTAPPTRVTSVLR